MDSKVRYRVLLPTASVVAVLSLVVFGWSSHLKSRSGLADPLRNAVSVEVITNSITMTTFPEGVSDDLSISLPPGRDVDDFVKFVIKCALSGTPDAETEQALVTTFGITSEDAALVRDRVFGGIVRAATGNAANRPDPKKDPFACVSFDRATRDHSIIASIYPQFARKEPRRSWWQFWR